MGWLHCLRKEELCSIQMQYQSVSVRTKHSAFSHASTFLSHDDLEKILNVPLCSRVSCTENKQERKQQRQKREKKTQHEITAGVLQWRLEIDRGGEMCGLSVGYCVGSVISGREWCIIIQNVKPAERS